MSPDKGRFAARMDALYAEQQRARNIPELELQRVFSLPSDRVVLGLDGMLEERIDQLQTDATLSPEGKEWQLSAYFAVSSLLGSHDTDNLVDLYYGRGAYRPTIECAMRYMKFLGFSDEELSATGIITSSDKVNKQMDLEGREKEEGIVFLDLRRPIKPSFQKTPREEYLERKVQDLQERLDKVLGSADLEAEDGTTLSLLDSLMDNFMFDKLPSFEIYSAYMEKLHRIAVEPLKPSK